MSRPNDPDMKPISTQDMKRNAGAFLKPGEEYDHTKSAAVTRLATHIYEREAKFTFGTKFQPFMSELVMGVADGLASQCKRRDPDGFHPLWGSYWVLPRPLVVG